VAAASQCWSVEAFLFFRQIEEVAWITVEGRSWYYCSHLNHLDKVRGPSAVR
jgi:hypothetical protein